MPAPELNRDRISEAYKKLDEVMETIINQYHLNYYELMVVFAMMDGNIKQQNISQYLIENVTRFSGALNRQDENLK